MDKKGIIISNINGRKTVKGVGYYEVEEVNNFKELMKSIIKNYANKTAFKYKRDDTIIQKTYTEFVFEVEALGTALISLGLSKKRIAIISENRYEWALSFFSIAVGTGIVVPLDKHLPVVEIENLINRGRVDAIFYSKHFEKDMQELSKRNTYIKKYICMDSFGAGDSPNFHNLYDLLELGKALLKGGDRSFIDATVGSDEQSILLFTSGTTSMAKGVWQSQRNICSDVYAMSTVVKAYPNDVHLSILPLHHSLELTVGMVFMIRNGICIAYCEGIKHIAKNIKEFNVTAMVVVPAIMEVMYKRMMEGIKKSGKEKTIQFLGKISKFFLKSGVDLRRTFFKKILEQLGPQLRLAVVGAAPLDKVIIDGFHMIGLNIIQGYGLTESSPVIAANNDFYNKAGTVGHPPKGIEVAINEPDDNGMGEIIARGPNIMLGYYEDENATKEAVDSEGWLYTGDLGYIDEDGYITITGRAKSMIVLTNGKKAFPEEYELLLNNIEGVKESYVWGNTAPDGDIQVCAKIVLNEAGLTQKFGNLPDDTKVADWLKSEIKRINNDIPQYKIIRYFVISYKDLIKTTTLKVKRPVEYKNVMDLLEKLDTNMRKANGMNIDII